MHTSRTVEIWVGIFVALGLAALFMLSMKVSNLTSFYEDEGYRVTANFRNIGSLKIKAPVTMGGVRVGRVVGIEFDQTSYQAKVMLKIDKKYDKIPQDTAASIFTAGLLGEQYIGLDAGGDDLYLAEGSSVTLTQSAVVLENLISQFLYSKAESGK
jgi:phospholipid/cholesterol/gamma-HCH transport system substrate-binding protein